MHSTVTLLKIELNLFEFNVNKDMSDCIMSGGEKKKSVN